VNGLLLNLQKSEVLVVGTGTQVRKLKIPVLVTRLFLWSVKNSLYIQRLLIDASKIILIFWQFCYLTIYIFLKYDVLTCACLII